MQLFTFRKTEILISYVVTMAEDRSCYVPRDIRNVVNRIYWTYLYRTLGGPGHILNARNPT